MKTYEELLSDIEEDMELMGASHIVYSAEENGVITDYDYLPSDLCMTSTTLKDLQEKLHEQMLYDKPLLYYTTRLAKKHGYQIQTVSYGALPENIKGDSAKMKQAFELACEQTEQLLHDIDWSSYGSILFISKSIGTAISSAYAFRHNLKVKSILFTPLAETFSFPLQGSIAFHGTADPWAETDSVQALAAQKEVPLFLTKNANHSLETGDVQTDLSILKTTMDRVERFIINP